MVTIDDARMYLGIDVTDDAIVNANVQRALDTARATVLGAVGDDIETYLPGDKRFDQLVLEYTDDIYNNRGTTSAKASNARHAWIFAMEEQLRLALRIAKREAAE